MRRSWRKNIYCKRYHVVCLCYYNYYFQCLQTSKEQTWTNGILIFIHVSDSWIWRIRLHVVVQYRDDIYGKYIPISMIVVVGLISIGTGESAAILGRCMSSPDDAIITSLWRQKDVTSFWRQHDVIIASCVRWASIYQHTRRCLALRRVLLWGARLDGWA